MPAALAPLPIPSIAGIGLRHPHIADVLAGKGRPAWVEVHAENFMDPTPASDALEAIRQDYQLSVHGVGLSLGSATGIDRQHLERLKAVCDRFRPSLVSEHLAWCVGDGIYLNDLLPVPYDEEVLDIVAGNVDLVQTTLKRQILIENVSAYIGFAASTMTEPEFLAQLARRTGCGLLLDINNVYVSAHNIGFDADAWIAGLPGRAVSEIHLAGHVRNETADGVILIDDHASRVSNDVWTLYSRTIRRFGRRPTLIEWDSALPELSVLLEEARRADLIASAEVLHDAA
jgi:uncharacterized protein (UPF0276 family)